LGKIEGAWPLQNLYFPIVIVIYIHIMERGIKGGEDDRQINYI